MAAYWGRYVGGVRAGQGEKGARGAGLSWAGGYYGGVGFARPSWLIGGQALPGEGGRLQDNQATGVEQQSACGLDSYSGWGYWSARGYAAHKAAGPCAANKPSACMACERLQLTQCGPVSPPPCSIGSVGAPYLGLSRISACLPACPLPASRPPSRSHPTPTSTQAARPRLASKPPPPRKKRG